jgi:hypothetical protein
MNHVDEPRNRRDYLWFASALLVVLMGSTSQLAVHRAPTVDTPAPPEKAELPTGAAN